MSLSPGGGELPSLAAKGPSLGSLPRGGCAVDIYIQCKRPPRVSRTCRLVPAREGSLEQ